MLSNRFALHTIGVCCILLSITEAEANPTRIKRQLSPAVQLETELSPLIGLVGLRDMENKRALLPWNRHLSPAADLDGSLSELISLQSVGKRQWSNDSEEPYSVTMFYYYNLLLCITDGTIQSN
ncbi:hypothetical protein AB6A40_001550 [Gnathostoma spinigerum]|uniref:Uncharacterized protein n=1 Tax=Gnathostoma spinigerum TaxID=75299 RepID=A0ABD6E5P9_9BILA